MMSKLLTREEFKRLVFSQSNGICVFCPLPAVDPHHIMERKLFEDGGYRLENGAGVCEIHHWACETTRISVEEVRAKAGITEILLPPGFDPSGRYDKWGNRIWPSGMRSVGPLGVDDGMRRALVAGGYFGLLMPADYIEE